MSDPYVGESRLVGFSFAPEGWAFCDGSLLSISNFEVLFTLIGTTYGGDGQSTFAVPDMRGRIPIHQGQGQGLSPYVLGQKAGTESVTLLPQNLPAHSHILTVTSSGANTGTPSSIVELGAISGDSLYSNNVAGITPVAMASTAVSITGGTLPHDNLMPTLTVRFCIAWAGVFPSQS